MRAISLLRTVGTITVQFLSAIITAERDGYFQRATVIVPTVLTVADHRCACLHALAFSLDASQSAVGSVIIAARSII